MIFVILAYTLAPFLGIYLGFSIVSFLDILRAPRGHSWRSLRKFGGYHCYLKCCKCGVRARLRDNRSREYITEHGVQIPNCSEARMNEALE